MWGHQFKGALLHCDQGHYGLSRGVSVRAVPVTANTGQDAPPQPLALGHRAPAFAILTGISVTLQGASFLRPFSMEQLAKL